jgi:hypothetical protein
MKPNKAVATPRPRGAVFVSYRQKDGRLVATQLAWTLRAMGIPVWHDVTDLPPGDTVHVIREALAGGLSGAILIVTDDIKNSPVVKNTEWPLIRELSSDGNFTLGILNAVNKPRGDVYDAPDQLVRRSTDRVLGRFTQHLKGLKQYRFTENQDETVKLAAEMLRQRLRHLRDNISARRYVDIDLATRAEPNAEYADTADLTFRWNRGEARDPSPEAREQLRRSFYLVASALREHTTEPLRFRGQTHLSFGLAIGASLSLGPIVQFASEDGMWQVTRTANVSHHPLTETNFDMRGGRGAVLIYVDLIGDESDGAYDSLARSGVWSERLHIRRRTREGRIAANDGDALVHELADTIRAASGRNQNSEVHLLLRAPLPVALLLGTLLNTLTVTSYEWSHGVGGSPARYLPVLQVRPGERNPITAAYV